MRPIPRGRVHTRVRMCTNTGLTPRDFGSAPMMIFAPKLCGVPRRSGARDYAFSHFGVRSRMRDTENCHAREFSKEIEALIIDVSIWPS